MKNLLIALLALLAIGCAKFPGDGQAQFTRIRFRMRLNGPINPNFIYVVAIRWSKDVNPIGSGPIPIVAPPWLNGMVGGRANVFMRYSEDQIPRFLLYRFTNPIPDDGQPVEGEEYLTNFEEIGRPVNDNEEDIDATSDTIEFEVDLDQIAPSEAEIPQLLTLQVNFLTMDFAPTGNEGGEKTFDALGNSNLPSGINQWVEIPLTRSGIYNNTSGNTINLEPIGDCPDPSLDIEDWEIEVRLP